MSTKAGPVVAGPNPTPQSFLDEVLSLQKGGFGFYFDLGVAETILLIEQLQLALRHPGNAGASAAYARRLIDQLTRQIPTEFTAIHEVIRLGWEQAL